MIYTKQTKKALTICFEAHKEDVAKIKPDPIARAVKLADLRHNSDLSRLDAVDDKALRRRENYLDAIQLLTE